eukprot:6294580-Prymnesium_polylepis.1
MAREGREGRGGRKPRGAKMAAQAPKGGTRAFDDDASDADEPSTALEWRVALAEAREREAAARQREKNLATELAVMKNSLFAMTEARSAAEEKVRALELQLATTARDSGRTSRAQPPPNQQGKPAPIPGLEQLFRNSGCLSYLPAAERWCRANGASAAADLRDPIFAGIVDSLRLPAAKRDRLLQELHSMRRADFLPPGSAVSVSTQPTKDCAIQ